MSIDRAPERKPASKAAQSHLEVGGIKPMPTILTMATAVVGMVRGRSESEPLETMTERVAEEVANDFGLSSCVKACVESYRLAQRRVQLDIPATPSVQDVAHGVVVHTLTNIARKEAQQ